MVLVRIKGKTLNQTILWQNSGANWLATDPATGALMTELKGDGRDGKSLISASITTDDNVHRMGLIWDNGSRTVCVNDVMAVQGT